MNSYMFEGKWQEMGGELKEWWGKLTDDELKETGGRADRLVGLLKQEYGYTRERAEVRLAQVETVVMQD